MSICDEVLDRLEDALDATLDARLAAHVAECPACRAEIAQAREASMVGTIKASLALRTRLKRMPRLASGCERAQQLIGSALDGEITAEERSELVTHLHGCELCRTSWEGFATLREVGAATQLPPLLRADLAIHPNNRLSTRRVKRRVDLRLATAAAYLLAAATVLFVGDPGHIARAGTTQMERASLYARAAVENRLDSYSSRLREQAATALGWVENKGESVIETVKKFFRSENENPNGTARVDSSDDGGKR